MQVSQAVLFINCALQGSSQGLQYMVQLHARTVEGYAAANAVLAVVHPYQSFKASDSKRTGAPDIKSMKEKLLEHAADDEVTDDKLIKVLFFCWHCCFRCSYRRPNTIEACGGVCGEQLQHAVDSFSYIIMHTLQLQVLRKCWHRGN